MSKEAMKMALEALETERENYQDWDKQDGAPEYIYEAITALREALAEKPAQGCEYCNHPLYAGTKCKNCGRVTKQAAIKRDLTPEQPAQQEPVVWMYVNKSTHETKFQKHMRDFVDHSLWSEVPLYGEPLANHELQCVCGAVWCGDEMVHLPDKHPPTLSLAQRKPLTDEQKRELIKKSKLWDMQVHIGWYSAPAKSFVEKAMLLIADIEAAHGIKENT